MTERKATVQRKTRETSIDLTLDLDGSGTAEVSTGIGFLDHMLSALACHGRFDLTLSCAGDLEIDDHHTAEDCALALGQAFDEALGERRDLERFAHAYAPLDEALARAVVDLSSRPFASVRMNFVRPSLGSIATENLTHVLQSFATAARITLHVEVLEGENDHHKSEAAFKATALALRDAVRRRPGVGVPSTKGVLE